MQNYLHQANLVVEAVVTPSTFTIQNQAYGDIETVHTLRITDVLKGNYTNGTIEVHTPGGQFNDIIQTVSHGSSLSAGESGIYMLIPDNDGGYDLLAGNAGKVTKLQHDDNYGAIHWGELTKYRSWRKLREEIGSSLGLDLTISPLTAGQLFALTTNKEFCVKLDNPVPNAEDKTVEFDVMAKSSVPGLKFARAGVLINYPAGNLGEWIVDQEKIEAEKGDITAGPAYTVDVKDEQEDQIGLTIESPCNNAEPHYVLDTVYEKLATLTVEVAEWGDLETMNADDFSVAGSAEFVNPESFSSTPGCTEFEDLCGEGEFGFIRCNIDGIIYFVDNVAGQRQSVGISGQNFGSRDSSRIKIPDADNNISRIKHTIDLGNPDIRSNTIIDWTQTYIEVNLSSNPFQLGIGDGSIRRPYGSGVWEIIPDSSSSLGCSAELTLDYSIFNSWYPFVGGQRANNYSPSLDSNGNPVALKIFYDDLLKTDLGANQISDAAFEAIIEKYACA